MRPGCPTEGPIYHKRIGELLEMKNTDRPGVSTAPQAHTGKQLTGIGNSHAIQVTLANGEHKGRSIMKR